LFHADIWNVRYISVPCSTRISGTLGTFQFLVPRGYLEQEGPKRPHVFRNPDDT
jgi:hypothetical protein